MPGYIKTEDYNFKIRNEIKSLLDASQAQTNIAIAEDTAIQTIKMYISGRYDCGFLDVAAPATGQPDTRNRFFIDLVITIALFKLYGQTGMKDIPTHRQVEYDEAMAWLRAAGKGQIETSGLTSVLSDDNPGEFIINSRIPTNWKT